MPRPRHHHPDGIQPTDRRFPRLCRWAIALAAGTAWGTPIENSGLIPPLVEAGVSPHADTCQAPSRIVQSTFFDHGDPTDYEQLMLECINRARADPAAEAARLGIGLNDGLDPGTITEDPKPPLAMHPLLLAAARGHAQWMLDNDTFSHTGVDGTTPGQRMERAGYVFSGSWIWGENISWGGTTGQPDVEQFTLARHDALFRSAVHRVNLCSTAADEVGVGIRTGPFTHNGITYNAVMVAQNFAHSGATAGPLVLGVIYTDANANGQYDVGEGIGGATVTIEGGTWHTASSTAGGYVLPYSGSSGSMRLTVSGPQLPGPVTFTLPRTGQNIKQDLDVTRLPVAEFAPDTMTGSTPWEFRAFVRGTAGQTVDLLHSTDLNAWTTVSQYTVGVGETEVIHQPVTPTVFNYYRLRSRE